MALFKPHEVLTYNPAQPKPRSTVKRYCRDWRVENGLPAERCDVPACPFHSAPLVWAGVPLGPILDHRDGCDDNNNPDNLRFVCPIAIHSWTPTEEETRDGSLTAPRLATESGMT